MKAWHFCMYKNACITSWLIAILYGISHLVVLITLLRFTTLVVWTSLLSTAAYLPTSSLSPPSSSPIFLSPSFLSSLLLPPSSFLPLSLPFPSSLPPLFLFFLPPSLYHKQVYYTPQGDSTQIRVVRNYAEGSNYQLGNLRYGTMFTIRVAAVNGAGEGDMNNDITGSTTIGG